MARRKRVTLGIVGVALAGMLLLSGCITMRSEISIKSDGSGTQTVMLAISKEMMNLASQGDQSKGGTPAPSKDPLADAQTQFKTLSNKVPGATFEPYTDATGKTGFKVMLPFKSLDELTKLQLSDKPTDSMDKITFTKSGTVTTLKMNVNTGDMASKASGDQSTAAKTPEEEAMQTQMMAAMGMDISYAIALPGKILDWSPKEKVTYDAATNKLIWAGDLNSKPLMISVKWDNAKKPEKINVPPAVTTTEVTNVEAPTAEPNTTDIGSGAAKTSVAALETLKRYTDAMMTQDQAGLESLMVGGQNIQHPLRQKLPDMFKADDLSMIYLSSVADDTMGVAEWQAQWTDKDGASQNLSGMDVLMYDNTGKIASIKTYVDPTEFAAMQGAGK